MLGKIFFEELINTALPDPAQDGQAAALKWNDIEYLGQLKQLTLSGQGKLQIRNGLGLIKYDGEFSDSFPNEHGLISWNMGNDECSYVGNVTRGKRSGQGELKFKDGFTCMGTWSDDKLNGEAVYQRLSQEKYKGTWKDGKRHGFGVASFASGNTYEGNWENGKQNGHGIMTWTAARENYVGNWKDGKPHGHGEYRWPISSKSAPHQFPAEHIYVGNFENGLRNGHGTFYYASGAMYHGTWKNNRKDGLGTFYREDGQNYGGTWVLDKFTGKTKILAELEILFYVPLPEYVDQIQTLRDIDDVIRKHLSILQYTYTAYSVQLPDNTRKYRKALNLFQLWTLIDDFSLKAPTVNLAQINRKLSEKFQAHEVLHEYYHNPHEMGIPVQFVEFLEFLTLVAMKRSGSADAAVSLDSLIQNELIKVKSKEVLGKVTAQEMDAYRQDYEQLNLETDRRRAATLRTVLENLKQKHPEKTAEELFQVVGKSLLVPISCDSEDFLESMSIEIILYEYAKIRKMLAQ